MILKRQTTHAGASRRARKLHSACWIMVAVIAVSGGGGPVAQGGSPARADAAIAAVRFADSSLESERHLTSEAGEAQLTAPAIVATGATTADAADSMPAGGLVAGRPQPGAVPAAATEDALTRISATDERSVAAASPVHRPASYFTVLKNANLRAGPGTAYPIVGRMSAGESYPAAAKNSDGSWLEVNSQGSTGWVSAELVSVTGDLATLPVAETVPPPPPPPTNAPPTRTPPPESGDPVIVDLLARINKMRGDAGLTKLRWTPELAQAAGAHTWDMATHHFFSHTGSDGSDVTVRVRRAGYVPVYWGEILTHVNGGGGPEAAFSQFWNSPHHHDIIMGDEFTDVGAAWISDPTDASFSYYTVVFGRR